jgi:hypothetical protein
VVGIPGKAVVRQKVDFSDADFTKVDLNHHLLPDPVADMMRSLQKKIETLEMRIAFLGKRTKFQDRINQYSLEVIQMKIYNTLTRKKEEFVPIKDNKVNLYMRAYGL